MKPLHTTIAAGIWTCLCWSAPVRASTGHCLYVQQGRSQALSVCEMPVDEVTCEALNQGERTRDAEYAPGACPVAAVAGTCDKGASKVFYLDGDPTQLEIGCGYQGGTWINPP